MKTPLAILALLCAAPAGAQEPGAAPKEIQAEGWINSEGASLAKLKGRVVVVEFWATWCPPCRASIPHLVEMRNKLDHAQVEIIGLSDEPKEKVEPFAKQMKMNYTVGWGSRTGAAYGVRGIPAAFVIDPEGKVAWNGHPMDPAFEATVTKLAATVKPLAAPEPSPALGGALAAAAKSGAAPEGFSASYVRDDGRKPKRELALRGLEYVLKVGDAEAKSGTLEEKRLAALLKALADVRFAERDAKMPAKPTVTITVQAGEAGRVVGLDASKGFGAFGKLERAFADLCDALRK